MATFGFIGVGNMGYPIFKATLKTFGSEEVVYTDASLKRCQFVQEDTGLPFLSDNSSVVAKCKYLVLAVKPQYFLTVLKEIKDLVTKDQIIISIAAGITIDMIKDV